MAIPTVRRVTGLILAAVLTALLGVTLTATPAAAATTLCSVTLQQGSSGDCVRKLQTRLNEWGLNNGNQLTVDGAFGPTTRDRVEAFQGRNRLTVDGVVGPNTRTALAAAGSEGLSVSSDATVAAAIRAVFPDSIEDKAIRVATCESGLNAIAININTNGTRDYGVFQFNAGGTLQAYLAGATTAEKIDNALHHTANIQAAYRLYQDRGWQPWACGGA
ncbi:MAG TPA: peptidoglycan-binding protein [Actinokineospora sp.]|nr:peptidoglycan-binding protein [Actinokineospora sp.]